MPSGRIVIHIAGVHALGSVGAAHYLTEHVADLWAEMWESVFSAVIGGEFDELAPTALNVLVSPREYVDALLDALRPYLSSGADLRAVIADAIEAVTVELDLPPGAGPSSTVALLRWTDSTVGVAVLGDSSIVLGTREDQQIRLCDDRLESVAPDQRKSHRDRHQQGSGYDDAHRQLLVDLQRSERRARNRDDGYRVAEATGEVGDHHDLDAGYSLNRSHLPQPSSWVLLGGDVMELCAFERYRLLLPRGQAAARRGAGAARRRPGATARSF
jgi:hypothetical protein